MFVLEFFTEHPFLMILMISATTLVMAPLRNAVMKAVCAILNLLAAPFVTIALAIVRSLPAIGGWIGGWLRALSVEQGDRSRDTEAAWSGWDVLMPIFWALLFVILAASDLFLVDLRLAAMLGIEPYLANTNIPVDLFLAVMFTAVAATLGFAIPELRSASLTRRPWAALGDSDRSLLLKLCLTCLALTIVAAAILWIWAENSGARGSSLGDFGPAAPTLFWMTLVAPLLIATIISGFAALPVLGVVVLLLLIAGRAFLLFFLFVGTTIVWTLDRLAEAIVLIYDVPARPGAGIINFFTQRMPEGWRPATIEFEPRTRVGAELWIAMEGSFSEAEVNRAAQRRNELEEPTTNEVSAQSAKFAESPEDAKEPVTQPAMMATNEFAMAPAEEIDPITRRRIRLIKRFRRLGA